MRELTLSPTLFFDTINAYQRAAALNTAIEMDLFTALADGNDTVPALAERCGASERGARILLDYLVMAGFLTKRQERYGLTQDSAAFLNAHSRAYVGAATQFFYAQHLRAAFGSLTQRVRDGGAPATEDVLAPEHDAWVHFARGMAGLMMVPAQLLARDILAQEPGCAGPLKILDIAAGHGLFGIALARQHAAARVVAQDWAKVLAVAEENALKAGVRERYELLAGSAFEVDFGTGYDLVLLANILHHFDAETNERLLRRAHAALKPGGRAVILEFVPNDDRATPPAAAALGLLMLATTPRGDAYTFAEFRGMLRNAGFVQAELRPLLPALEQVVVAYKPTVGRAAAAAPALK
jgi:ubiquinone/menaquinone biosynthesis C-methylase UbiE